MPTYETDDGIDIYYEWGGAGPEAPVVAFFNGMTQSTEHWARQVGYFEEDYRVLRWDARGQGESGVGAPITMDKHVRDFTGLLDALGVDRAHLVGFSHGARLALGVAARRAGRVGRLVVCSATARPTARARTIVESWKKVLEAGGLEAMSWAALPTILGNDYLETQEDILEGIVRASVRRNTEAGVGALLEAMDRYPSVRKMAEAVDVETLVLSADEDPLVDLEGVEALAELSGGERRLFEGVGHTIPIEAPEDFADVVTAFLGR